MLTSHVALPFLKNQENREMSKEKIEKGDLVHVDFNVSKFTLCHETKVLYVPCATGDSWVFKDVKTGQIHNVSEGCTITLLQKSKE